MWYTSSFIRYAVKVILGLLILFLSVQLLPFFYPIVQFIASFFSPLILGVVLYYMFRPLVRFMIAHHIPFALAMCTVFVILGGIVASIATFVVPTIITSLQQMAVSPAQKLEEAKDATLNFISIFNLNMYSYEEIKSLLTHLLEKTQQFIFSNTYLILTTITHLASIFVVTPFCLFYLLKDDQKFYGWTMQMIPSTYQPRCKKIFYQLDKTLLNFFNGQVLVALVVSLMAFVGLSIIQVDNLIFMASLTFLLSLIPYLGTLIAIIPPTLVGLTSSYLMGASTAAVMISIHVLEANLITPHVMMKRLDVHPLTLILLIVASFSLFGVTGPLWITPLYVFLREIYIQFSQVLNPKENEKN
ncbi:AI-2E family transporter [Parachlamydia sp. AcF125]|uniref:AI-2E family transporter n=1 Tax=Parachlamydia sp. AcF125 TaxID=2795736 RepID=UPI001BCA3289|nr:AI-2E family transporter [Parachlamydia sp. AcF125]MBS4167845.1 putative transport protein [Parachlamydia sp. AcF125]